MLRTKNISFFQKDTFDKEDRKKTSFYMFSHEVFSRGKAGRATNWTIYATVGKFFSGGKPVLVFIFYICLGIT